MSKYDIAKVRKKIQERQGSRFKDPNEFRPPQAKDGEEIRYRFFVLPPLSEGDKCADGVAVKAMELFYVQNGAHWFNNRPHQCPRVHDELECPLCNHGFELMGETQDKDRRRDIARQTLPRTQYAVNIYFPKDKVNPEELRGTVKWMNATKQVFDQWEACIMREDEGDPDDPQAYGVFYDEDSAYLFQLTIKKKNKWNDYSSSKFLTKVGRRPLAAKDGEPLAERIQTILKQRHDLFTKFPPCDLEQLEKAREQMKSGEPADDDAGFDEDETQTEEKAKPKAAKPKAAKPKAAKPKAPKAESEEDIAGLGEDVEEDGIDEPAESKPAKAEVAETEEAEAGDAEAEVDDPELANLLEQIDDDDDE